MVLRRFFPTAFLAAFLVVLAAGAPVLAKGPAAAATTAAGNADMLLAPNEVRDTLRKAKAGDSEAAARLSIHYDAAGQPHEAMKWLVEAAKLGDCPAVQTLLNTPKLADKTQKLAKSYATQWACKPGGQPPPPAPIMY